MGHKSSMELIILKIGGSVSTFKENNLCAAKEEVIRNIANEIKQAREEKKFNLILVHGAGPFGHKLVSDFKINNGLKSKKDFEGFIKTQESVRSLNNIFVRIFYEQGVELIPVIPHENIVQKSKRIIKFDIDRIDILLNNRKIPVMYGDMVPDEDLKGSVVSGDAIIAYLARHLMPQKVLLGTDVDGIYNSNPKSDENAKLIPFINNNNFENIKMIVEGSKSVDVTDGMRGKFIKIKEKLNGINCRIIIFSAIKEGNVKKALLGEHIRSTELYFYP